MNILKSTAILLLFVFKVVSADESQFDILAKLDTGPGNVTVLDNGRIMMSLHQFYAPNYTVVEVKDNILVPFPNKELANPQSTADFKLDSVLGIRSDSHGIVWMLDNGMRSGVTPKLVGWNTKTNQLQQVVYLPSPITPKDAFVNDFAVDTRRNHIYISDPAGGKNAALIVVNLNTGTARRVLEGDASVLPENVDLIIDNVPIQVKNDAGKLLRPHIGVNPITEDLHNEWVYFAPMHGHSIYRIKADDLVNESLDAKTLSSRVQRYSNKPISDGMTIDKDNNIYLGELAENAIGVISADKSYRRLAQCSTLSWVDSFSFGAEGKLYAVVNRLHQSATLNGGGLGKGELKSIVLYKQEAADLLLIDNERAKKTAVKKLRMRLHSDFINTCMKAFNSSSFNAQCRHNTFLAVQQMYTRSASFACFADKLS